MIRARHPLSWVVLALAVALLLAIGCKTSSSAKTADEEHAQVQVEADVKEHQEEGPSAELDRWFRPDGGVLRERVRSWAGSTTERDTHVEVDAGVASSKAADTEKSMGPAASCAFGGWLWAGAIIALALCALRFFRRTP